MVHYMIKAGADVIEVVGKSASPKVEWLNGTGSSTDSSSGKIVKRGKRGTYLDK